MHRITFSISFSSKKLAMAAAPVAPAAALKEFELTWVVYDPNDPLGAVMALFTLSPVCVYRHLSPVVEKRMRLTT